VNSTQSKAKLILNSIKSNLINKTTSYRTAQILMQYLTMAAEKKRVKFLEKYTSYFCKRIAESKKNTPI